MKWFLAFLGVGSLGYLVWREVQKRSALQAPAPSAPAAGTGADVGGSVTMFVPKPKAAAAPKDEVVRNEERIEPSRFGSTKESTPSGTEAPPLGTIGTVISFFGGGEEKN